MLRWTDKEKERALETARKWLDAKGYVFHTVRPNEPIEALADLILQVERKAAVRALDVARGARGAS